MTTETKTTEAAGPFLKWAGGKRQMLPHLLPVLRQAATCETLYVEPFLGAGAVYFALHAENRAQHASLSDINAKLIAAYTGISDRVEDVIVRVREYCEDRSPAYYYRVRGGPPATASHVEKAAWLLYVNHTCYNGLYRENLKGGFNVPFGRYSKPWDLDADALRASSVALRKAVISTCSFETAVLNAATYDRPRVIYFDPPYMPVSKSANFTRYTSADFGMEQQKLLRDLCFQLKASSVPFVLSNADTEDARDLYKEFAFVRVDARRNINSAGAKRGAVGELLVTNIDSKEALLRLLPTASA